MLDITKWIFVQFANFVLLLIILNIILFKPFLRLFKEREDNTKGALEKARAIEEEKNEILSQINSKLSEARNKAKNIFEELSKEGLEIQKETVDSAHKEAVEINRQAKEEIKAATEKARAALRADVEAFSKQIVDKLVGV
jgi:F-type H+-transporting ATPase subunit b